MAQEFIFRNNVSSRLLMAITPNQTTLTVLPGDGEKFPEPDYEPVGGGEWFAVTLWDRASGAREICYCTGRAGDELTVLRGREGTTPFAFPAGAEVAMTITAGVLEFLRDL